MLRTGVIADDFTGATDIASGYVRRGHRAVVVTDPAAVTGAASAPSAVAAADQDVVVVALKSRTAPVASAVEDSLRALDALLAAGCERFVFKYCSTFDSTDRGNIGPVLDALADRLGADHVVVAPAFPDNGRTVDGGVLYVNGERLEDSPMRHHPLTPMTRSRVADILRPQTTGTVAEAHLDAVRGDLRAAIADADGRYVVTDALTDDDLVAVARATADDVLTSGAAGLALGAQLGDADAGDVLDGIAGARLVVCGSASARTREQIAHAIAAGLPTLQLDAAHAAADPDAAVADTLAWIAAPHERNGDSEASADTDARPLTPVVYTVGDLSDVDGSIDPGVLESVLARVVAESVARLGVRKVIVAGGETSGAVVNGLGVDRLVIGPAIAPGVCWARADAHGTPVALALKSGNFGAPDMFTEAWEDAR